VKKRVKISGIIAVSVLYCTVLYFIFGFLNNQTQYFPDPPDTNNETSYFGVPDSQNGYALPLKISFSTHIFSFETSTSFSNKLSTGVIKSVEQTFTRSINRYILQSVNFPVRLRKEDILFPFHYFW